MEGARQWESEEVMLPGTGKGSFVSLSLGFSVCIMGPRRHHRLLGEGGEAGW